MTVPTITSISFDQNFYTLGQTITATVDYQMGNQYSSSDFLPVITDILTGEVSSETIATFHVGYNSTGPEAYTDSFTASSFSSYWDTFTGNADQVSGFSSITAADNQAQASIADSDVNQWAGVNAATAVTMTSSAFSFRFGELGALSTSGAGLTAGIILSSVQPGGSEPPTASPFISMVVTPPLTSDGASQQSCIVNGSTVATIDYELSVPYSRIREADGMVYWDTSSDGYSWTNIATAADSDMPFSLTSVYPVLYAAGSELSTTVGFTDYMYAPANAGIPDPVTPSASDTDDRTWSVTGNVVTGNSAPFSGTAIFTATA